MIKKTLIDIMYALRESKRKQKILKGKAFQKSRLEAAIIRLVHSIEKGLSIKSPRLGFGYKKIERLALLVDEYMKDPAQDLTCVYMAGGALKSYCNFHDSKEFESHQYTNTKKFCEKINNYCRSVNEITEYGGIKRVLLSELDCDINEIEKLFRTRHSIREFENKPVEMEKIKKAISLAQHAPSACNRQAVRVYVINGKKLLEEYNNNLEGIGGFAEDVDKFLIVTGKLSSYDEFEYNQFIVSAGIFVGYLSLALHAYKIGACIIQRSLRYTKQWKEFCEKYNIPDDEQIICMIGIGNMKESTMVPISRRYPLDKILRELT